MRPGGICSSVMWCEFKGLDFAETGLPTDASKWDLINEAHFEERLARVEK